jgi:hypothetical protein
MLSKVDTERRALLRWRDPKMGPSFERCPFAEIYDDLESRYRQPIPGEAKRLFTTR